MTAGDSQALGMLLRRFRLAASLSQEALAKRAGLSANTVAALERGRHTAPRADTVQLLATALELDEADRATFVAAAMGTEMTAGAAPPAGDLPKAVAATTWMPSLPIPPNTLVGRDDEAREVVRLLQRDGGPRLITLTGPGGVGKTRLALALAEASRGIYADGVVFVDLSAVRDPALVPSTVAQTLGVHEVGSQSTRDLLAAHLRDRRLLLILDNFEQVLEAVPLVLEWLAAFPRLAMLVTSRTALRVRGEQQFRVPPLATPLAGAEVTVESLAGYAAIRLFVDRAQAVRPEFILTGENAGAVAKICRKLDGLPLAIELAAARVTLLPPASLLDRLQQRLAVLTGGARDLPARQQTLRATIDWSYELLTGEEQILFARMGVFAVGCALAAIEAICDPDDASDVLDSVASLLEKSLLLRREAGGEPRVEMLATLHEYAREKLEARGELARLQHAHAGYYLALAEEAEPALKGPDQKPWLARMQGEHDNLRAALRWSIGTGESGLAMRLGAALWRFWYIGGYLSEGRRWLDELLAMPPPWPASTRAWVFRGASELAVGQADYERASALAMEARDVHQEMGDILGVASVLNTMGNIASGQGDLGRAAGFYEQSLAIRRGHGDVRGMAVVLNNLGTVARHQGDLGRAAALHEESLVLRRDLGDTWGVANALYNLANVAHDQGDLARAARLHEESLTERRNLDDRHGIARSLVVLGAVARLRGDMAQAVAWYAEGLTLSRAAGDTALMVTCLAGLASLMRTRGEARIAARLLGAVAALREAGGAPLTAAEWGGFERDVAAVRAALWGEEFEAAWAAGQKMPLEQAISEALAANPQP